MPPNLIHKSLAKTHGVCSCMEFVQDAEGGAYSGPQASTEGEGTDSDLELTAAKSALV